MLRIGNNLTFGARGCSKRKPIHLASMDDKVPDGDVNGVIFL